MTRLAVRLMILAMVSAFPADVLARGGGGRSFSGGGSRSFAGGGGGGGGRSFEGAGRSSSGGGNRNFAGSGGSASRNFSGMSEHTPSMSRSSSFNAGAGGARSAGSAYRGGAGGIGGAANFGGRPTSGELGHFLNMPQGAGGVGGVGRGPGGVGGVGKGPGGVGGAGGIGKGPSGVGNIGGAGKGPGGVGGAGGVGKGPGGLAGAGKGPGGAGGVAGAGKGIAGAGKGIAGAGGKGIAGAGAVAGGKGIAGQGAGNRGLSPQQQQHAQNIRNNIQGNHNNWYNHNNNWFNHGWWGNHGGAWNHGWNYWHGWGPGAWWNGAGWGALTGFMVGSWATPMYYGYGAGGNVAYQGDGVYVDGQNVGTPQQYYNQAQQLAQTPVPADAATGDWMPLGVFTVSSTPDDDHPVMMMQMAVNKQGNIAGMYYNTSDDVAQPIQGAVDEKTQRAAWTVGDKENTVLETGIFNLTKDETPVLVHFGDEKTQQWLMVRLNKPETGPQDVFGPPAAGAAEGPSPGPPAPSGS